MPLNCLPWQCIGPDALLDAVRLGEKVIGVAPAAPEKELLADSAAGVVEETHQPSVAHPRHGGQVALLVRPSAGDAGREGRGEVPLDAPRVRTSFMYFFLFLTLTILSIDSMIYSGFQPDCRNVLLWLIANR